MELNLRTVLVVIGALVMLAILIDGFRRMRKARQEALKIDVQSDFKFPEESFASELPNGGARVIGSSASIQTETDDVSIDATNDSIKQRLTDDLKHEINDELKSAIKDSFEQEAEDTENLIASQGSSGLSALDGDDALAEGEACIDSTDEALINEEQADKEAAIEEKAESTIVEPQRPTFKPLNLDEQVPLLMEVEEFGEEIDPLEQFTRVKTEETQVETQKSQEAQLDLLQPAPAEQSDAEHIELTVEDIEGIKASVQDIAALTPSLTQENPETTVDTFTLSQEPTLGEIESESVAEEESVEEAVEENVAAVPFNDGRQEAKDLMAQAAYAPVKKPGANAETLASRSTPDLVLITHVTPHDESGFSGEDVLYLVNSCDLRHGEKGIFHRFEKENGEGCVQFSMANSINPGTFDPSTLLYERIYGLSLFMSLPGPEKAMDAFEAMTEMASVIARNLGGDVHDETHSIMALQTIEHNRQQVRDFVRRQKLIGKK